MVLLPEAGGVGGPEDDMPRAGNRESGRELANGAEPDWSDLCRGRNALRARYPTDQHWLLASVRKLENELPGARCRRCHLRIRVRGMMAARNGGKEK